MYSPKLESNAGSTMAEINTQDFHSLKDEKAPIPSDMEEKSHQLLRRKKRKWDQPDESLFSAALAVPGILPINNLGSEGGVKLPGAGAASAGLLENPLTACYANLSHVIHTPIMQQQAAAVVQKLTQPKLQDELLIAREIVINDAEPTVRYKLTKRQTQEEIQKCTGAVVITRGRYHPPNIVLDGEKPLYLHISAGAHLKETAERIIAVDRAAAMVEEMLKQGHNLQTTSNLHSFASIGVKVSQPLSTCVYLGFDADPSLNIAARICGPNDHYINHIMNETGATVVLRGHSSGIHGPTHGEEGHQPLHLFLSSNNPKGLEDATLLAENLLDTISRECGITRVSPSEVYSAVPLPRDLLVGVQSSGNEPKSDFSSSASLISSVSSLTQVATVCSISAPGVTTVVSYMPLTQPGGLLRPSLVPPSGISNFQSLSTSGTSYSGYAGIYPQATPLQQVALALRRSNPATSTISPSIAATGTVQKSNDSSSEKKRLPPKRKFQELSPSSRESASHQQGLEFPERSTSNTALRNVITMPSQKKLVDPPSNGMPPPPRSTSSLPPPPLSRSMPPPPPKKVSTMPPPPSRSMVSPSATGSLSDSLHEESCDDLASYKSKSKSLPDTLVKIMEYGEDDDDDDDDDN